MNIFLDIMNIFIKSKAFDPQMTFLFKKELQRIFFPYANIKFMFNKYLHLCVLVFEYMFQYILNLIDVVNTRL